MQIEYAKYIACGKCNFTLQLKRYFQYMHTLKAENTLKKENVNLYDLFSFSTLTDKVSFFIRYINLIDGNLFHFLCMCINFASKAFEQV